LKGPPFFNGYHLFIRNPEENIPSFEVQETPKSAILSLENMSDTYDNKTRLILQTLRKSSIFSVLKEDQLREVSTAFSERSFKNNEYLFMQGDPSDFLFIVAKGRVKMLMHTGKGKDVILEIKSPGELFCCSAVLDNRPFPESAQAMEDVSVIQVGHQALLQMLDHYPPLQGEIARYSGRKLKDAHEMMRNLATEKVEVRIASILLKLSEAGGGSDSAYQKIGVPVTRQEIAEMVGTTVETCIRTIRRFQKEGMVQSQGSTLSVNRAQLAAFVESH
jgi:CRP/FNR family transcriptional regulator